MSGAVMGPVAVADSDRCPSLVEELASGMHIVGWVRAAEVEVTPARRRCEELLGSGGGSGRTSGAFAALDAAGTFIGGGGGGNGAARGCFC